MIAAPAARLTWTAGTVSDDGTAITGEWRTSPDGQQWERDFGLTYTRRPS